MTYGPIWMKHSGMVGGAAIEGKRRVAKEMVAACNGGRGCDLAAGCPRPEFGPVSRNGAEEYPPHPRIGEGGWFRNRNSDKSWVA